MEGRMTLANMVIEAGGKNGVIAPDEVTYEYVNARTKESYDPVFGDDDATYHSVRVYKSKDLQPMLASPHSPDNKSTVLEKQNTNLNRAYIGSCTGGKITDFIAAAQIIQNQTLNVDTFIVPATTEIANELKTTKIDGHSLQEIFENAGARVGPASCAACLGGPADTFGRLNGDEVCISTTNRNFPGRMGSKQAQVYLASPYTVAASAVTGKITDPRDFL